MAGMSCKLLTAKETRRMFKNDPKFAALLQTKVDPKCLEVIYGGTASATFTEIGTAATAEFQGGANEITTVAAATRVNTPGGSYFYFYVTDGTTVTQYYAWFSKKEVFTVVCDTRVNTPGGSYFTFQDSEGSPTSYYAWFSKYQVQQVVCTAASEFLTGEYFTIADSQGVPTKYYVWMDKNGDGSTDDPGPVAGYTSAPVNVSAAVSADDVGTAVAAVLDALAGFGASNSSGTVTITHATKGDPSEDAVDVDTGFTISKIESGGTDPAPGGTGVECDIKAATTADDVGTVVAAAIDALGGCGAANVSGTVTVTMATKGNPTDAVDVDTGFTITVTESGGADPSASGTGAECDISASTTAADVGTVLQGVINALANVTAAGTATVTITNDVHGLVTATTDGNTGFTITQLEQSADPFTGTQIFIASSDADDTDLVTKDMRKVNVIGYTTTDIEEEEINLNGATKEGSTANFLRIIHYGGSDWGSAGQDAKGTITLSDYDGTAFMTIAAGSNESEGGVIWLPNHFHCLIAEMDLTLRDNAIANAGDGVCVQVVKNGLDPTKNNRLYNTDPDNPNIPISVIRERPHANIKWPTKVDLHGSDVGKLTIQEGKINNAVDFVFTAYIIIWYKSNT